MAINQYPKYKISINPDSKKLQTLQPGDIVRRQYVDGLNTIYTLMTVLETGEDEIINDKGVIVKSPFFIGALLEGDIPNSQQLLDFVRITNLFNADRSGALYMTASDSNAPFLQIIDKLGTEKSVCLPYSSGGIVNQASKDKYSCLGESHLSTIYSKYSDGAYRAYKVVRNSNTTSDPIQIKLTFADTFQIQEKVLISYKIRSNKKTSLPYSFGYTNGSKFEGTSDVSISNNWEYKLHIVQIDSPARETRSFTIDLNTLIANDWVEIAELNIIKLSDVANFSEAGKAIIGNISSVVDPVFGTLKGYGIHTENFYATQNVGIAGTLTAGDANGFSSTFYAGRIYKNMIKNSLSCDFNGTADEVTDIKIPAKIGSAYRFKEDISLHKLTCQETGWALEHKDEIVSFSIWIYSTSRTNLNLYQNTNKLDTWEIYLGWRRYYCTFPVTESGDPLYINFETNDPLIVCSPQLEKGDIVSQYQPTDGVLKEGSDSYGAWFCSGGIGGTIQNPLLIFGVDGSIRSRNDDFYILPDGSTYFKGKMEIGDKTMIDGITLIENGKINTAVLNVRDIFSQNIETETIVGANLTFQKGTIGGWKITANNLTSEITPGRDHIELSTTGGIQAVVASKTVWQLSPTGSGILASGKIRWDEAGNATIAGWNITDDKLYSTPTNNNEKIELNSNGSIQSLTGSTVNWLLNNDGSGKLARGNVTWDKSGNLSLTGSITANSGKIGGWIIDSDSIYSGTKQSSNNYATSGITISSTGALRAKQFRIDTNGNAYFSGSLNAATGTFSGNLSAAGGTFSGTLSAVGGTFSGNLSAAGGTFTGTLSAVGGTFTGTLRGVDGEFSGKVTATSGRIGNWNITNSEMTYNDVHLSSNGDLYCTYGGIQYWKIDNLGNASFAQGKVTLNKDGSGQLANGKISWTSAGVLTIDNSVKVNANITAEQINGLTLNIRQGFIGNWEIMRDGSLSASSHGAFGGTITLTSSSIKIEDDKRIRFHITSSGKETNVLANGNIYFEYAGGGGIGTDGKITWDSAGRVTIKDVPWNGGTISNNITIQNSGMASVSLNGYNSTWQSAQILMFNRALSGQGYKWQIDVGGSQVANGDMLFNCNNSSGTGSAQASPYYRFKITKHGTSTNAVCGAGAYANTSDIRLKNRGNNVTGVLDIIENLDVFHFTMKDDEFNLARIGVSAQNIQQYFPEFVSVVANEDTDKILGVDYAGLGTTIAIGGIKEILAIINKQTSRIEELETLIKNRIQ